MIGLETCLISGEPASVREPSKEKGLHRPHQEERIAPEAERRTIEACKQGNLRAFETLYETHGPRMKSVAMNLLGNTSDAEDAVQDAFLRIYRSMAHFRGQSALSTWAYRILINSCYDLMRKRRRRLEAPELEPQSQSINPSAAAPSDHSLRLTLEKHLARLDARSRNVFLLFEVEGFTHREIAEILEIREGTSKSLLFEAKRSLQRLLWQSAGEKRSTRS